MKKIYKISLILVLLVLLIFGAMLISNGNNIVQNTNEYNTTMLDEKLALDMSAWNYDSDNDIYYQIGNVYCTNPESTEYESLGIYVPGKYFNSEKNEDGTYTCTINNENQVGNYTADNAPIVMPINTAGYSEQKAPSKYSSQEVSEYTDSGIVYVNAGCRGKQNGENYTGGAPWGVTDLKAAIKYIRFNSENIPANTENIFTFGHSGGGAQSAIVGASGDSELYTPYLESIGAAMVDSNGNAISDSVAGSMCWCPITNLDYADEAYEWNMGQFSDSGSRSNSSWTKSLSDDLATEYATYINNLKLKDPNGNELKLEESDVGVYLSGSYYDYMLSVVEESLNNFLNDTQFPYTPSNDMNSGGGMADGAPSGGFSDAEMPSMDMPVGDLPSGDMPSGNLPADNGGDMQLNSNTDTASSSSVTYQSAQEYINSLNNGIEWVTYDSNTNTAHVTSMEGFVKTSKNPSKSLGAFDDLDRSQAENDLFGNNKSDYLHFDNTLYTLLKDNQDKYSQFSDFDTNYVNEYENDLKEVDKLNQSIESRLNMYTPLYYLSDYYNGSGSSNVAKYWRIHSGIEQSDTALTTETNLALALNKTNGVEKVEFETVWNQGHTTAERQGDSTTNFINWINECLS